MLLIEGGDITELLVEGVWRVIADRNASTRRSFSFDRTQPLDEAITFRPTATEAAVLIRIASKEEGSLSALVVEGIWRVVEDRVQDPQYQTGAERVMLLLTELSEARADLHSSFGQRFFT